ncbi:MAG: NfeD family protein [Actinomycetota bacterium]
MFLIIGFVGVALLALALIFDDVFEGILPESDWFSLTSLATFCVAFGFGAYVLDTEVGWPAALAAVGGATAGVALALVALRWSRSLSTMSTDATPAADDLIGREGRVITPVPVGSTGEALVRLGGQQMKLTAVAAAGQAEELERGAPIVVVRVLSSTRVEVQAADAFWGDSTPSLDR